MRYEAERAERQYHAVEPENRLVARSLELRWEESLRALRQAEAAGERADRALPRALTDADRKRVQALAGDLPALWRATETTNADRKAVIRCLVESVRVQVRSRSERVHVAVHWKGGAITEHEVIRPVKEYSRLEGYAALKERMTGWRHSGMTIRQIVDRLNDEGWHAPKHPAGFTIVAVRTLLTRWGMSTDKAMLGPLAEDEWWLPDLIQALPIDGRKLRKWVECGWVHARHSPAQKQWIVWADADEVVRLRQLRDRSRRGVKHYPTRLTIPKART